MMKMLIQLDEEKVLKDGKYDLDDMWRLIGKRFVEYGCTVERQSDGSVVYSGTEYNDYYTAINLGINFLEVQPWFAKYCTKWIWYDNDDDESLPYSEEDILANERIDNPLFARKQA